MLTTRKFGEDERSRSERAGVPGTPWSAPVANPTARFLPGVGGEAQRRVGAGGLAGPPAGPPEPLPASHTATEPLPTAHLSTLHLLVVDDDDALRRACC